MTGNHEITARLGDIGHADDTTIDLVEAGLLLAAWDARADEVERGHAFAEELTEQARALGADVGKAARDRVAALNGLLFTHYGFKGDVEEYDNDDNANLARVIIRRRGLPVSLGILYIHAADALRWDAEGLSFPGHFLLRVHAGGDRLVVDPFNGGRVLDAPDLRALLKQVAGIHAELKSEHYRSLSRRDVLLRLQNNLKLRAAKRGDLRRAAAVLERMVLIAPREWLLWYELGLMHARLGHVVQAIEALETFVTHSEGAEPLHRARTLLDQLRAQLN